MKREQILLTIREIDERPYVCIGPFADMESAEICARALGEKIQEMGAEARRAFVDAEFRGRGLDGDDA
jgi:hypothetical protein